MTIIDEVRKGDVRFQIGWNQRQPRGRLLTFCEVRLERQRVIVKDFHDVATGARTARIPAFLLAIAKGLVEREDPIEEYPRAMDALAWLEDNMSGDDAAIPYAAFMANPTDESFGVQMFLRQVAWMVDQLGMAPDAVGTVGDLARRLKAAIEGGFDFDRQVIRTGPIELARSPGERRRDGGHAAWLRVRYGRQEVYGQRRYGARGRRRGPDHERQLADALEGGILLALEGGMALMDVAELAQHLAHWHNREGALAGFERAAADRAEDAFLERWVAAELRNTLHQFGDVARHAASLEDVERALAARARRVAAPPAR